MPPREETICCSSNKLHQAIPAERFRTELTLEPPDATSDQAGVSLLDEDYFILSTIHSAKAQEWKSVSSSI
jgi:superfamily I DNA/RNA helicase